MADSTLNPADADDIIGDAPERCMCLSFERWLIPAEVPEAIAMMRRERERNRALAAMKTAPYPSDLTG